MEETSVDAVRANTNVQMGEVLNSLRLPVLEKFSSVALKVNVLELSAKKDDLLKKLRSEDVISVKMFSPPFHESTSVNNLVPFQAETSDQR